MADRPTILLTEDEVIIRFAISEALRDEGFVVLEAANADEALTVFEATPMIHLLVTDINMPGSMDGVALATRLKAAMPELPVLLVSAHPPCEALSGADDFIRKPFPFGELVRRVQRLIAPQWATRDAIRAAS